MSSFASVEDLATHIQKNLSAEEAATASQILDIATQVIKDYTQQELEAVDDRIETFRSGRGVWLLAQLPVRAISVLTIEGDAFTDYDVNLRAGIISRTDDCWWSRDAVSVTYDSGFTTIPDSLKGVCLSIGSRLFQNEAGAVSETLESGYSVAYPAELANAGSLTEPEMVALNPYRVLP